MIYLSCPECETPYSVIAFTIARQRFPVNVCTECGWRSIDYYDPAADLFEEAYMERAWPLVMEHLRLMIPAVDAGLAERLFRGSLSSTPEEYGSRAAVKGGLAVRSHRGYGAPLRAYRSGTGRSLIHLREAYAGDLPCLLTDTYRMPVLFVAARVPLALRMRYYSALIEGRPAQVFLYSRTNARDYAAHNGLFQPERIVAIGLTELKKSMLLRQFKAPVYTYDESPPEPLHAFIRVTEEIALRDKALFGGERPLDPDAVRKGMEELGTPPVYEKEEEPPAWLPENHNAL